MEDTNNCFFVLCCIRYEKFNGDFHKAFIWQNHLEQFDATKASMQQVLVKDTTKFIRIKMFPAQLRLFLIFDIQKFLHSNISLLNNQVKFDDNLIEKMGNFCVSIYDSHFSIQDFLLPLNYPEITIEPSINLLMSFLLKKKMFQDKINLNNLWTNLEVEGSFNDLKETDGKRSLIFSNLELGVKKNDQDTILLKFELKTPKNEFYSDVATLIYAKNSLILKFNNLACSKAFYYATTKLNSNQKELLESIVSKLEELVALKNSSYMVLENGIEVDEPFDESFNKNNKFHSIETLLSLIQVYLNLRQILCSNLKVN
ncbi:hypothetical protein BpHYR1_040616 [Brachionus plicatilis]|uniref:Uncharacterized protein n=1 Tax=Brachionus plicatilis TaxID=10195 RepID=A0A3M7RYR0_BRAPC|nr:hypothetical protein BpHYR1_040616 [Brachionus plicatilis]